SSQGGFSGAISFSCAGGPTGSACTVAPNNINLTSGGTSTVTVSVAIPPRASALPPANGTIYALAIGLSSVWGVFVFPFKRSGRRVVTIVLLCLMLLMLSACGGG